MRESKLKTERDDLVERLRRNGITLIGAAGGGGIEDWQIVKAGEKSGMGWYLSGLTIRLADGTEIKDDLDGLSVSIPKEK